MKAQKYFEGEILQCVLWKKFFIYYLFPIFYLFLLFYSSPSRTVVNSESPPVSTALYRYKHVIKDVR